MVCATYVHQIGPETTDRDDASYSILVQYKLRIYHKKSVFWPVRRDTIARLPSSKYVNGFMFHYIQDRPNSRLMLMKTMTTIFVNIFVNFSINIFSFRLRTVARLIKQTLDINEFIRL